MMFPVFKATWQAYLRLIKHHFLHTTRLVCSQFAHYAFKIDSNGLSWHLSLTLGLASLFTKQIFTTITKADGALGWIAAVPFAFHIVELVVGIYILRDTQAQEIIKATFVLFNVTSALSVLYGANFAFFAIDFAIYIATYRCVFWLLLMTLGTYGFVAGRVRIPRLFNRPLPNDVEFISAATFLWGIVKFLQIDMLTIYQNYTLERLKNLPKT
ncbi:unnamed protein product [Caenorhabditis auriculariae]|uniref:Uncharacterized protein n=1 Tax=Caenorhabditis auriculariae TaxID=2777116 RepID=A0A8S1H9X6_9PELO|nr:unnamed protein product [Caenorhabditis auriculariae]